MGWNELSGSGEELYNVPREPRSDVSTAGTLGGCSGLGTEFFGSISFKL